jgi:hypothetical protein
MKTINLPLWGYALVALAAMLLLAYEERDRILAQVRTVRRYIRPRQASRRKPLPSWDGAILAAEQLRRNLLAAVGAWALSLLRSAAHVLTAPWRAVATSIAQRRLRHLGLWQKPSTWTSADYHAKRVRAIAWLGDRYLLAKPINRRRQRRHA